MIRFASLILLTLFVTSSFASAQSLCTTKLHDQSVRNRDMIFRERFLIPMETIANAIGKQNAKDAVTTLTSTDYRGTAFKLETLAKFHESADWAQDLVPIRYRVKALEDNLGAAVDAVKTIKIATQYELPAEAIHYLEIEASVRRNILEKIVAKDWIGSPSPIEKSLVKVLESIETPPQKEVAEHITQRIQKLAQKILDTKIDPHNLEEFHKVRRMIRELVIEIQSSRGGIKIVKGGKVPASLKDYMNVSEDAKKFLSYEETSLEVKNPVEIPEYLYLGSSYFVDAFGKVKERGEIEENMIHAVMGAKLYNDHEAAKAWIVPQLKSKGWTPWEDDATKVYTNFIESKLMQYLAKLGK